MGGSTFKNPIETLKNVALNVSTGGLYGVAQGAKKAVTTGKILAGGADALASYGTLGSVLTPTVGTKNSLAIQSAIAGGALAAAPAGSVLGTTAATGATTTPALGAAAQPVASGILPAAASSAAPAAAGGITAGEALVGSTALTAAGTAYSAMTNKPPKLPGAPDPAKIDQAAIDAANGVQTADAEARRRRASKRQSSVLSNFQGASQVGVSPATLQPAQPRRSVLG